MGRPLEDLRISVTDRCNFRCVYCMPKEVFGPSFAFLPRSDLLSFEEITRVAQLFASLGVKKLRITGGEPLVRKNLEQLIGNLADIPGIEDIAMTTNGSLLDRGRAQRLKDAGLKRITISLDSLDNARFQAINEVGFPVERVLAAIDNAVAVGLSPVKVNMVVKRGVNEEDILPMAAYFRGRNVTLRFIEFMDVGTANGWRLDDVVTADEILSRVGNQWPLEPVPPSKPGEVARRFRYRDGQGEIGVINSVSQPFCHNCSRARLSPDGQLYLCLFGQQGADVRAWLRDGLSDQEIQSRLQAVWSGRRVRYSEERSQATSKLPRVEMFRIGG
nr:GTP 3',8-cyclase MoaA [Sulfobacillus harzensis]